MTARQNPKTQLQNIIESVEAELSAFYDFTPKSTAYEHLISAVELAAATSGASSRQLESMPGSVWVSVEQIDDIYIGMNISPGIQNNLENNNPLSELTDANLNAFCVLVEELSHFHLILNRLTAKHDLRKLEIEWQGEVDKLLMCAKILERQCGDPHIIPLARKLFDQAHIFSQDKELYREATKYAARFWFDLMETNSELRRLINAGTLKELQDAYYLQWPDKVKLIDSLAA